MELPWNVVTVQKSAVKCVYVYVYYLRQETRNATEIFLLKGCTAFSSFVKPQLPQDWKLPIRRSPPFSTHIGTCSPITAAQINNSSKFPRHAEKKLPRYERTVRLESANPAHPRGATFFLSVGAIGKSASTTFVRELPLKITKESETMASDWSDELHSGWYGDSDRNIGWGD